MPRTAAGCEPCAGWLGRSWEVGDPSCTPGPRRTLRAGSEPGSSDSIPTSKEPWLELETQGLR